MLHSVLTHGTDVGVHYLHSPRFTDRGPLQDMVGALGGRITFYEIADERVADLPDAALFTPAMWYRILLPELLDGLDRVLHLDADTIAVDGLTALWETDLGDAPVAAVTNVLQHDHRHRPASIGLAGPEVYFNSGVLLMNLDRMRRDDATGALRAVATSRAGELVWPDQDALNLVFGAERVALHPRWNCMNSVYAFSDSDLMFGSAQRQEALQRPAIRHFEGPGANKPWNAGCRQPLREAYFEHRRATPWPHVTLDPAPPPPPPPRRRRSLRQLLTAIRPV